MRRNRDFIGPAGMGGMVSLWGQSSLIRSIQYGATTAASATTATATIASVDTNNACLFFLGSSSNNTGDGGHWAGACVLTNSTTVTTNYDAATDTRILNFCVVEFQPGVIKSRQSYVITCVSAASATATITAVDVTKAQILFDGQTLYSGAMSQPGRVTLTNTTTLTVNRSSTDAFTTRMYGYVIEYF